MISSSRASLVLCRRSTTVRRIAPPSLPPPPPPAAAAAEACCRSRGPSRPFDDDADIRDNLFARFFSTTTTTTAAYRVASAVPAMPPPPTIASSSALFAHHHHHHHRRRQRPSSSGHDRDPMTTTQQYRHFAGRKDRASTSLESRPPTPKQRKKYHRRMRDAEYERTKHARPNSKASVRRLEDRENTERLIEIAKEEEMLKIQLAAHFEKVNEIQAKIESTDKFRALLDGGTVPPDEVRAAARDAAKKAAEVAGAPRPPLPSWWRDRMTYDWGDALVDDLMGNSSDLTSSPSPFPLYMGGEYGRLKRKVARLVRARREEERFLLEAGGGGGGGGGRVGIAGGDASPSSSSSSSMEAASDDTAGPHRRSPVASGPGGGGGGGGDDAVSDKLLSDLLRAHRDANGKRTAPVGLASALGLLRDLDVSISSSLGIYSYVSLLTCCSSVWEGRKVDELRRDNGVRSNGYFWSALVDVYARDGDYRGAESVLDELVDESRAEYEIRRSANPNNRRLGPPVVVPPLSAYTSFYSACYKLVSRSDVHPSIKSDAANRAWSRWKEMRIHSVAPDVMAYGALMRIFAAQGRPEQALDLLDEVMMQMMMPVNAKHVLNTTDGMMSGDGEILKSSEGDDDGWYDDREGNTVRVKPTTLLFTSALKAVAKSHEIASKFNGGTSRKNRRRESVTSYHGRLTRKIVVLAEQAEVRQDDGFVSALMLCAAAAGDASTARAIYLASKVRRLDHLRTCGGRDHLSRLQGLIPEDEKMRLLGGGDGVGTSPSLFGLGGSSNAPALRSVEEEFVEGHEAYEHREYGNDTRPVAALLLAHSKAMEAKGLGSMWAGRYNRGYLCPNSLRYIEAYNQPQYENMAIPGLDSVQAGLSPEGWEKDFDDSHAKDSKALRKKHKFNIKQIMDDGHGNRKDDQDSFFDGFDDPDEDWRLQLPGIGRSNGGGEDGDVSRDWLNDQFDEKDDMNGLLSSGDDSISTVQYRLSQITSDDDGNAKLNGADYSNDFDSDSDDDDDDEREINGGFNVHDSFVSKQRSQPGTDREALVKAMAEVTNDLKLAEDLIPKDFDQFYADDDDGDEGDSNPDSWFDEEEFNKLMEETMDGIDDTEGGDDAEELDSIPGVSTNDFAAFRSHLQQELVAERSTKNVDDKEARQLFEMMRTYYDEKHANGSSRVTTESKNIDAPTNIAESGLTSMNMKDSQRDWARNDYYDSPVHHTQDMPNKTIYADDYIEWAHSHSEEVKSSGVEASSEKELSKEPPTPINVALPRQYMSPLLQGEEEAHIIELQKNLPGMPINRIEKVADEFSRTLAYPSILRLTLAVRENMPESFSPQCLTRVNLANAKHVMSEAEREGLVDAHLLNGMLRVYTNSGRIEPALRFYDIEYKKHGVTPTTHSDRLLFEMLVKKKRIGRAFKLKQDIENDGRSLDLLSYGSLIEHFGRTNEVGSALLLIKECIDTHGVAPGEKCLKNIRLICRQENLTDRVGLEKMVGEDPLEWMRRGIELKSVDNKKGKSSSMQYGMNRMVDI